MNSMDKKATFDVIARFASTPLTAILPSLYPKLLEPISNRVSEGQQRAHFAVNRELITTYWHIGRDILERQSEQGWGTKVIDRLSSDLKDRKPGIKGFSPRNLKYMRLFAELWSSEALCNSLLHNCSGGITWFCWTSSTTNPRDFGTRK